MSSDSGFSESGLALSMGFSVQRSGTQFIDLAWRNRRPMIAPGGADIGDDRRHFIIRKTLRKGRHAIGHGVAGSARRETAIQHHPDWIDSGFHLDGLIGGERGIACRLATAFGAMADRALLRVHLSS